MMLCQAKSPTQRTMISRVRVGQKTYAIAIIPAFVTGRIGTDTTALYLHHHHRAPIPAPAPRSCTATTATNKHRRPAQPPCTACCTLYRLHAPPNAPPSPPIPPSYTCTDTVHRAPCTRPRPAIITDQNNRTERTNEQEVGAGYLVPTSGTTTCGRVRRTSKEGQRRRWHRPCPARRPSTRARAVATQCMCVVKRYLAIREVVRVRCTVYVAGTRIRAEGGRRVVGIAWGAVCMAE